MNYTINKFESSVSVEVVHFLYMELAPITNILNYARHLCSVGLYRAKFSKDEIVPIEDIEASCDRKLVYEPAVINFEVVVSPRDFMMLLHEPDNYYINNLISEVVADKRINYKAEPARMSPQGRASTVFAIRSKTAGLNQAIYVDAVAFLNNVAHGNDMSNIRSVDWYLSLKASFFFELVQARL